MKLLRCFSKKLVAATAALWSFCVLAQGLSPTDMTQDQSGGKTLSDTMGKVQSTGQEASTMIIGVAALIGLVIGVISLIAIYKAAKDEREKPTSAIVGILVGGFLCAAASVVWVVKNQFF